MTPPIRFDELLEAVELLPDETQAELVDVICCRLAVRGHHRVMKDVQQTRQEFAEGKGSAVTPDDMMREIES